MKSGDEKTGQSRPKLCPCYERRDSKRDFSNPPLMQSDLRGREFQTEPYFSRVFWRAAGRPSPRVDQGDTGPSMPPLPMLGEGDGTRVDRFRNYIVSCILIVLLFTIADWAGA